MTVHTMSRQKNFCFLIVIISFVLLLPSMPRASGDPDVFPRRIVSLSPLQTENVFLLGAGDQLVGNTTYCTKPAAAEKAEKIGSVMEISIEKIVGLRPDLILASNLTPSPQVEQLSKLGLRTITFHQAASFQEMCDQFVLLGKVLGRAQQAERIVAEAKQRVSDVQRRVEGLPSQKVFLQVGANPLFSSVEESFTNQYIVFSGGENIAGNKISGAMSTEQVLALAPDVIIIAVMGSENGVGANEKIKWQNFTALNAAKTGRIHVMDPDQVCSPSPLTFAQTLEAIARLIQPTIWNKEKTGT